MKQPYVDAGGLRLAAWGCINASVGKAMVGAAAAGDVFVVEHTTVPRGKQHVPSSYAGPVRPWAR